MIKLRPYQDKGVDRLHQLDGRAPLADQMGLGKSVQFLQYCYEMEEWPSVVVCPAFLKANWLRQISEHYNMKALVLEGLSARRFTLPSEVKYVIVNYDILLKWVPYIMKVKPKIIGLDECRAIKNPDSQRSVASRELCRTVRRLIGMDGTPIENRPIELYPFLHMCKPEVFDSILDYTRQFCAPRWDDRKGWIFDGATNLPTLHKKLKKHIMIRRLKKDVLKDLPSKQHQIVPLSIKQSARYQSQVKETMEWIKKNYWKLDRMQVEMQAKYTQLKQTAAMLKVPAVIEWLDKWLDQNDGKLLVFGIHHAVVEALNLHYKSKSLLLYGKTPHKQRSRVVLDFEKSKVTRMLICNMDMAQGWDCRATSTTASVELPWKPSILEQATDRVHGINRGIPGEPVISHLLVAENTIEDQLCATLKKKQAIVDKTLDGGINEEFSVYSEITEYLLKGGKKHAA